MRIQEVFDRRTLPRADVEILLAHLLKADRTFVIAHPEYELSTQQARTWHQIEWRRRKGEPIADIIGKQEFYGRPFLVDRRVLIPRPATETLIDVALAWLRSPSDSVVAADAGVVVIARTLRKLKDQIRMIADVGTGSGCIAVTLALERPYLSVIATDASTDALDVARENATLLGALPHIAFRHGHLMDPLADVTSPFLLVANLPYVPSGHELPWDIAGFEPMSAITAGKDGLDVIRSLVAQAKAHPACYGIILECEKGQVEMLDRICTVHS